MNGLSPEGIFQRTVKKCFLQGQWIPLEGQSLLRCAGWLVYDDVISRPLCRCIKACAYAFSCQTVQFLLKQVLCVQEGLAEKKWLQFSCSCSLKTFLIVQVKKAARHTSEGLFTSPRVRLSFYSLRFPSALSIIILFQNKSLTFALFWSPHPAVLRDHSWFCAHKIILWCWVLNQVTAEAEVCKQNVYPVLSPWLKNIRCSVRCI